MATLALALTLLLQVATTSELRCVGFIGDSLLPPDIFIAGTSDEGITSLVSEGQIAYLNGPAVGSLKPGEIYWVVRPDGKLRGNGDEGGARIYYMSLGTIRIESLESDGAVAVVLMSCQPMTKGDLVIPPPDASAVQFKGDLSSRLTPYPEQGLASVIILGRDDVRTMGTGDFCFIGVGSRDGVKPGDRFTVYRVPPDFEKRDLLMDGEGRLRGYRKIHGGRYDPMLLDMLRSRRLPPRPVGDVVVVDVRESTAAARVVNSLVEIAPGDLVVRR